MRRFAGHAIFALSQSKAPDGHILAIAHKDPAEHVRSQAYFWLAQMGDERAQGDITAALQSESSDDVREEIVFALSQLKGHGRRGADCGGARRFFACGEEAGAVPARAVRIAGGDGVF